MSQTGCTCGSGCQSGCGCRVVVLPDNPVELYAAENINTLGIGVYDSQSGNTFQFRGVYSENSSLIITLDAGNNAIAFELNIDQIIDSLPQATTTQRGVGETATDAEAIAKASITTFLTPSNLAALGASLTFAGLVELATDAETQAGVSTTLAVTPAGLASVVTTLEQTTTFADAVGRAAAVPAFEGQFGAQLDTDTAYVANGATAGDWTGLLTLGSTTNELGAATTLTPSGFTFLISGNGQFEINQTTFVVQSSTSTFNNGVVRFGNSNPLVFDWGNQTDLNIAGVQVPAASVLTTAGLGVPNSRLLNTFISTANLQTGWAVTNPSVTRTLDVAASDLATTRAVLGTLINDLKAVLLPAT
jgi:hypothetical protein